MTDDERPRGPARALAAEGQELEVDEDCGPQKQCRKT